MDSPVDRIPKVGEVWRLPETVFHPPVEAKIVGVWPKTVEYLAGRFKGEMRLAVFRASARFLRERG
jgi:hypothetical protein